MTLLWPGLPQKSAQANLRQTLYLLKQAVPELQARTDGETVPLLLAGQASIQVNKEAGFELDVVRFESLIAGASKAVKEQHFQAQISVFVPPYDMILSRSVAGHFLEVIESS